MIVPPLLLGSIVAQLSHRPELALHLLVALALTWSIGFERELRGSAAGDRTFSLVGLGSAVVGYLALNNAPNALAGVVTGVGFIGAGVIIHSGAGMGPTNTDDPSPDPGMGDDNMSMVRGVTTAATIYLAAAVGAACGQGQLLLAGLTTGAAVFLLEVRHARFLRFLDGRHWRKRFVDAGDDPSDA